MEKNVPISKKLWNMVRFVLYMIQKGISKQSLLADFNATLKRGKHLIFHNRRRVPAATADASQPRKEYEFSCSDTPNYSFPFNLAAFKKKKRHHISLFACGNAPPPTLDDDASASKAVLELLSGVDDREHGSNMSAETLTALSPYLPWFGRSTPLVRPLRVTDSPFPLGGDGDVANGQVDEAADEFIKKFYKNLNHQKRI